MNSSKLGKIPAIFDQNTAQLGRELQVDFVSSQKTWQILRISGEP